MDCGAGSGVRPSVSLSAHRSGAAGLLLGAPTAKHIDRHSTAADGGSTAARGRSSKFGKCHGNSRSSMLSIDLFSCAKESA